MSTPNPTSKVGRRPRAHASVAQRKRLENLEHARAVRSVRSFTGAPLKLPALKKERAPVWVLIGHYRRKPSELLGIYRHYNRGKRALDAAGICGSYFEVELSRQDVRSERE